MATGRRSYAIGDDTARQKPHSNYQSDECDDEADVQESFLNFYDFGCNPRFEGRIRSHSWASCLHRILSMNMGRPTTRRSTDKIRRDYMGSGGIRRDQNKYW